MLYQLLREKTWRPKDFLSLDHMTTPLPCTSFSIFFFSSLSLTHSSPHIFLGLLKSFFFLSNTFAIQPLYILSLSPILFPLDSLLIPMRYLFLNPFVIQSLLQSLSLSNFNIDRYQFFKVSYSLFFPCYHYYITVNWKKKKKTEVP